AGAAVLDPRCAPRRIAVLDTAAPVTAPPVTALPSPLAITTSTSEYRPGHATIALSGAAPAGSALVVSENYFPGWSASVDGRPTPVYRADFNLIGVPLPAGARRVELSFRDPALATGKGITIVAVLLAVAALAAGLLTDRRRARLA
ncbi:MAG TPA: YfhO family protein, partial [Gemmatimonadales bacterium]|nr:YfhO family protein [Gemmatimonadales bacterium]